MKLIWRSALLTALIALCATACAPLPWASSPQATSNQPVFSQAAASYDLIDFDWVDNTRERAVPVRLYVPKNPTSTTPLVVFSHGMGGSRNGYSYLADDWASHGIASLHVQHVGSDRSVWQGSRLGVAWRLYQAAGAEEAIERTRDVRFALDQLLTSAYAKRINPERIAAAGHSYGANTSMLLAGAQAPYQGKPVALTDARFKAAILISSPPFYGEEDFTPILQTITLPTLHITSTADVIEVPGYHSAAADRIKVFDAMGGRSKTLAVFKGGSHSMFTDRSNTGGAELNPLVKKATSELTRLFLLQQLSTKPARQDFVSWQTRHAEILERFSLPAERAGLAQLRRD